MTEELKNQLQECDTLKARLVALRPLPAEAMKILPLSIRMRATELRGTLSRRRKRNLSLTKV